MLGTVSHSPALWAANVLRLAEKVGQYQVLAVAGLLSGSFVANCAGRTVGTGLATTLLEILGPATPIPAHVELRAVPACFALLALNHELGPTGSVLTEVQFGAV